MRARNPPRSPATAPTADQLLPADERARYLDALRDGDGLFYAARRIGRTATFMRRLRKRDPVLDSEVNEALAEQDEKYVADLRKAARRQAIALQGSARILEVELATWVPGYEHLRRDRVKVDARLEHAIRLDPAVFDTMPLDKLRQLRDLLAEFGGEVIDGTATELESGEA